MRMALWPLQAEEVNLASPIWGFFEILRLAPKGRLMDVLVDYTIDTKIMTR
jgi:hypothetical protein